MCRITLVLGIRHNCFRDWAVLVYKTLYLINLQCPIGKVSFPVSLMFVFIVAISIPFALRLASVP